MPEEADELEQVEEGTEEEEQPKPKSRKKLFVIGPLILILLGGGGFLAYQKFIRRAQAKTGKAEETKKVEAIEAVLHLDPFTVNLADAGGVRFLRTEISLGLDKELQSKGKEGDPVLMSQVRDAILQTLSTKKSEELLTTEGKQKLREEIIHATSPLILKAHVTGVFFTDFIVQ